MDNTQSARLADRLGGQLSLAVKLNLTFGIVLLLVAALTALALVRVHVMGNVVRDVADVGLKRNWAIREMERTSGTFGSALRALAVVPTAELAQTYQQVTGSLQRYDEARKLAVQLSTGPQAGPLFDAAAAAGQRAQEVLKAGRDEARERGGAAAPYAVRMQVFSKQAALDQSLKQWADTVQALSAWNDELNQALSQQAAVSESNARRWLIGGGLSVLLLSGLMSWLISRDTSCALRTAVSAADRIACLDLAQPLPLDRTDEIGTVLAALEQMRRRTYELAVGVRQTTRAIRLAGNEINQGSQHLSERTEQAASSVLHTTDQVRTLGESAEQISARAQEASQLSTSASNTAHAGEQAVAQAVATMREIETASRSMSDIVGIINDIAFQTSILALNAAIEAASAGDRGRGFGVVAGEVRTLALRAAKATADIRQLIDASLERVTSGVRQIEQAGSHSDAAMRAIKRVNEHVAGMATEAAAQLRAVQDAAQAMSQLDSIAQQNAAIAEQSAAASHSLMRYAVELDDLAGSFKLAEPTEPPGANA